MIQVTVRGAIWCALIFISSLAWADDSPAKLLFDALGAVRKAAALPAASEAGPVAGAPTGAAPQRPDTPIVGAANSNCPRLGRLSSIGAVGPRPADYEPSVLWPANSHCEVHSFRDLQFPAAEAQRKNFGRVGQIPCERCERGFHFDDWPKNMPESKLLELKLGQPLKWKGARYQGAVVLTGAHPIGSTPCRQYRWTLSEGGNVAAERHGLFCHYRVPDTNASAWYQVL